MRIRLVCILLFYLLGSMPELGSAQDLGGSVHIGTLGLGGRLAIPLGDVVNLRGGIDFQPFEIEADLSDVVYDLDLPSPSFSALLDWHPGGGGFRASGGAVLFANELELKGTPTEDVDFGGQSYSPSEIGTLIGSLGTAQFGPYLGIGWGDATTGAWGFAADLGVVIHGTPDVELRATGPVGGQPSFQSDLEAELADINDEIESVKVYPILNLGLSFGF